MVLFDNANNTINKSYYGYRSKYLDCQMEEDSS